MHEEVERGNDNGDASKRLKTTTDERMVTKTELDEIETEFNTKVDKLNTEFKTKMDELKARVA